MNSKVGQYVLFFLFIIACLSTVYKSKEIADLESALEKQTELDEANSEIEFLEGEVSRLTEKLNQLRSETYHDLR